MEVLIYFVREFGGEGGWGGGGMMYYPFVNISSGRACIAATPFLAHTSHAFVPRWQHAWCPQASRQEHTGSAPKTPLAACLEPTGSAPRAQWQRAKSELTTH